MGWLKSADELLFDDTYTGKRFTYALKYRPPTISTLPKGWIVGSTKPHSDYQFGTVDFPHPLSRDEVESYELAPLDPNDPINLKKAWEAKRQQLIEQIDPEKGAVISGLEPNPVLLSKDTRPENADGWRITHFDSAGQPAGHETYNDIVEAIDYVAAHKDAQVVSI